MRSNGMNSFERLREAVENHGLVWKETAQGIKAQFQTPGHSERDLGTSVTYNGKQTLINSFNGDVKDILDALGLTFADLDDQPRTNYNYPDGRVVTRSFRTATDDFGDLVFKKSFTQSGNKKGTALYGVESLTTYPHAAVLVVEGEKDVATATHVLQLPAVSQAQGASTPPEKANWAPLAGRDVIIVQDKDKPGRNRADKVLRHLEALPVPPASIRVVEASVGDDGSGADLSDHVAAGHGVDELIDARPKVLRRRVRLVPATSVKTKKVEWLIDQWIPKNMLTLLAGREGIGKSTIACGWVAEFTKRGMNVAYLNTEDSREYTVKPRLEAAGADLTKVSFIDVALGEDSEGSLCLPEDTHLLAEAFTTGGIDFVVLDAAKSAMNPKLDGYKDDDVRQFLEPLVKLADAHKITILGLVHFGKAETKDTGKLVLGSIAWSQIARSVLSAAVDEEDGSLIVSNTKGNLAKGVTSRKATISSLDVRLDDGSTTQVGRVQWGGETDQSAADLLVRKDFDDDQDSRTDAEVWLSDYLTCNGPTSRATVFRDAAKEKVASQPTIKRAFKKLGGVSTQEGFPRTATWSLPSRITQTTSPYYTNNGDPTDPTGDDLHKRNDPTGEKTQSDHTYIYDPTGENLAKNNPSDTSDRPEEAALLPAPHVQEPTPPSLMANELLKPAPLDPAHIEECLRCLSTEGGLGRNTVEGSLTVQARPFTDRLLDALIAQGRARFDGKKYWKVEAA